MKYGVYIPIFGPFGDARVIIDIARETEAAGWDGLFIWDQITGFAADNVVDNQVALTAIALNTERIKFGILITPLARRRPPKYAREMLSLDHLSNARLICGVGLGNSEEEFENLGEQGDLKVRAAMLDEALEVVTGLWREDSFSYDGQYYHIRDAKFLPKPLQKPRIPIWTAGVWPGNAPFRRAARWEGVFPLWRDGGLDAQMPVEEYPKLIDFVRSMRETDTPFDVIHGGKTSGDAARDAEFVQPYAEAGVTWWLESISPWTFGGDDQHWNTDAMRKRITQGPPTG